LTSSTLAKATATALRRPALARPKIIVKPNGTLPIHDSSTVSGPCRFAIGRHLSLPFAASLTGFRGLVTDWQQETGNRHRRHHRAVAPAHSVA
jgi:hypothetical protein